MNFPTIYELIAIPILFAQEVEETGVATKEADSGSGSLFGGSFWFPMLIIAVVYVLIMMIMPRNDQKKNKEMLSSLKKNDRVITAGGIFGTVMTARKEDPFVTLRIDESTNTRIKVLKTSISRVITGDEKSSEKNATEEEGAKELPA